MFHQSRCIHSLHIHSLHIHSRCVHSRCTHSRIHSLCTSCAFIHGVLLVHSFLMHKLLSINHEYKSSNPYIHTINNKLEPQLQGYNCAVMIARQLSINHLAQNLDVSIGEHFTVVVAHKPLCLSFALEPQEVRIPSVFHLVQW